jgi:hypothetical protein
MTSIGPCVRVCVNGGVCLCIESVNGHRILLVWRSGKRSLAFLPANTPMTSLATARRLTPWQRKLVLKLAGVPSMLMGLAGMS